MRFGEKEIELKDGTTCILRSPNEQDAEKMIEYLKMTSEETHFMVRLNLVYFQIMRKQNLYIKSMVLRFGVIRKMHINLRMEHIVMK